MLELGPIITILVWVCLCLWGQWSQRYCDGWSQN